MTDKNITEIEWRPKLTAERAKRVEMLQSRYENAGSIFKKIRERLGLTQVEAARRLSTTQANVSKVEKRETLDLVQIRKLISDSHLAPYLVLRSEDNDRTKDVEIAL